jgi:uncharacterized protein (DUF697 family)
MKESIELLAELVNILHDVIILLTKMAGFKLTDKDLHFWVIGILGILLFFLVHAVFRHLAKWSLSVISLIYSFTVILVIVFAIEIQQGITNRGNMEFEDAVYGLWGFVVFFLAFAVFKGIFIWIRTFFKGKSDPER